MEGGPSSTHDNTSGGPAGPAGQPCKFPEARPCAQARILSAFFLQRRHGIPKDDQECPKEAQGHPKGAQGHSKGDQEHLKGAQVCAKEAQGDPKAALGHPKEAQGRTKESQREPRQPKMYKKLPINRPSGRYVSQGGPNVHKNIRRLPGQPKIRLSNSDTWKS